MKNVSECVLNQIPTRKISEILALKFDPVLDNPDDLKKFLVVVTGCDDNKFKVYTNGRGGVGLICMSGLFGEDRKLELRQFKAGYAVVFRYEDGGHDIFNFDYDDFNMMFASKSS